MQEMSGPLGIGRRPEDGLLVRLQDVEPMRQVLGMVGARLVGYLKIGAQEGRAQFGDQFLEGIGVVATALCLVAVEPMGCARPMRQFM